MPKPTKAFNFMLTLDSNDRLDVLSTELDVSRSRVIRKLIDAAHTMSAAGIPMCSNGASCLAPQLHVRTPIAP